MKFYKKAKSFDRSITSNDYNFAKAYVKTNNFSNAFKILNNILKDDPNNRLVKQNLAFIYFTLGESQKSIKIYKSLLAENKADSSSRYNLALIYKKTGIVLEAENELLKILEIEENDSKESDLARKELYLIMNDKEDYEKAAFFLSGISKKDKKTYLSMIELYKKIKNYAKLLESVDEYLNLDPDNLDIIFEKTSILLTKLVDPKLGFTTLQSLLEKGYDDFELLEKTLYDFKDLPRKEEIKTMIDSYKNQMSL